MTFKIWVRTAFRRNAEPSSVAYLTPRLAESDAALYTSEQAFCRVGPLLISTSDAHATCVCNRR